MLMMIVCSVCVNFSRISFIQTFTICESDYTKCIHVSASFALFRIRCLSVCCCCCRQPIAFMYVDYVCGICECTFWQHFFLCCFSSSSSSSCKFILFGTQKADMQKIHTNPDTTQPFISFTLLLKVLRLALSRIVSYCSPRFAVISLVAAASSQSASGRRWWRRRPRRRRFGSALACHCRKLSFTAPVCIELHSKRAHRTFWIWFQLRRRHRTD